MRIEKIKAPWKYNGSMPSLWRRPSRWPSLRVQTLCSDLLRYPCRHQRCFCLAVVWLWLDVFSIWFMGDEASRLAVGAAFPLAQPVWTQYCSRWVPEGRNAAFSVSIPVSCKCAMCSCWSVAPRSCFIASLWAFSVAMATLGLLGSCFQCTKVWPKRWHL